jgi:hypothetical protein
MGADAPVPNPNRELAVDQQEKAVDQRDSDAADRVEKSLEALDAEIDRFLASVPVAEGTAAKLNRLLRGLPAKRGATGGRPGRHHRREPAADVRRHVRLAAPLRRRPGPPGHRRTLTQQPCIAEQVRSGSGGR